MCPIGLPFSLSFFFRFEMFGRALMEVEIANIRTLVRETMVIAALTSFVKGEIKGYLIEFKSSTGFPLDCLPLGNRKWHWSLLL